MADEKTSVEHALRARALKRVIRAVIFLGVAGAIIYGLVLLAEGEKPAGDDKSRSVPVIGRQHVPEGTVVTNYNSNPPTSGSHYATPARAGFYDKELPDERVLHNLEHGDVWVSYKTSVGSEVKDFLRSLAADPKVIVTARDKNDADIAVAGWGRLDAFNLEEGVFDAQRVKDFIVRYRNRGPEKVLNTSDHLPQE